MATIPYVLKANNAFTGLEVQLNGADLTAVKGADTFQMDALGFSLDAGSTTTTWVDVAAGSTNTTLQAIIPAIAPNEQATTLQVDNLVAIDYEALDVIHSIHMTAGAIDTQIQMTQVEGTNQYINTISPLIASNVHTPDTGASTSYYRSNLASGGISAEQIVTNNNIQTGQYLYNYAAVTSNDYTDPTNTLQDIAKLESNQLTFKHLTTSPFTQNTTTFSKDQAQIYVDATSATLNPTSLLLDNGDSTTQAEYSQTSIYIHDTVNDLTISNAGVTFTPDYPDPVPWSSILAGGGSNPYLTAVVDNAPYTPETLALVNTLHIDNGTAAKTAVLSCNDFSAFTFPTLLLSQILDAGNISTQNQIDDQQIVITSTNNVDAYVTGSLLMNTYAITSTITTDVLGSNTTAVMEGYSGGISGSYTIYSDAPGVGVAAGNVSIDPSNGFSFSSNSADGFTYDTASVSAGGIVCSVAFNDGMDTTTSITNNFNVATYDTGSNVNLNMGQINVNNGDNCALDINQKVSGGSTTNYLSSLAMTATVTGTGQNTASIIALDTDGGVLLPKLSLTGYDSTSATLDSVTLHIEETGNTNDVTAQHIYIKGSDNFETDIDKAGMVVYGLAGQGFSQYALEGIHADARDFSIAVDSGHTLKLDVVAGAVLELGSGCMTDVPDSGLTGQWLTVLIAGTTYKIPLMSA
jgi:hypothetical protein